MYQYIYIYIGKYSLLVFPIGIQPHIANHFKIWKTDVGARAARAAPPAEGLGGGVRRV